MYNLYLTLCCLYQELVTPMCTAVAIRSESITYIACQVLVITLMKEKADFTLRNSFDKSIHIKHLPQGARAAKHHSKEKLVMLFSTGDLIIGTLL